MRVSGTVMFSSLLSGDLVASDVSGLVTSYCIDGGLSTLTESNSIVQEFFVNTNADGDITGWDVIFNQLLSGVTPAASANDISDRITFRTANLSAGSQGANIIVDSLRHRCISATCSTINNADGEFQRARTSTAGAWESPTPIPLPAGGLLLLGALGAAGFIAKRKS